MKRTKHPNTVSSDGELTLYEHIGSMVRTLREKTGMTQEDLARDMSTTANTVSRWETATYKPSAGDLDRLARIFSVGTWAFFPAAEQPPTEAHKALLSATGDLPAEDLAELERYADFIRVRRRLEAGKSRPSRKPK